MTDFPGPAGFHRSFAGLEFERLTQELVNLAQQSIGSIGGSGLAPLVGLVEQVPNPAD